MKRWRYKEVAAFVESQGYKLVSTDYKKSTTLLTFLCPKGHEFNMRWTNFYHQGSRCSKCFGKHRLSYEFVKQEFERRGFVLLSKSYKNNRTKLDVICPKGHRYAITWDIFSVAKYGCGECIGNIRLDIAKVRKAFNKEGYKLLTTGITSAKDKLKFICPNKHEYSIQWNKFQQGKRCGRCKRNGGLTFSEIRELFNSNGLELLDPKRNGRRAKDFYKVRCEEEHETEMTVEQARRGVRCSICRLLGSSKVELELLELFNLLGTSISHRRRDIIPPYELDFYFPDQKLAVEYCGLYWHSEVASGKPRDYHYKKMDLCRSKGIRLITIFEDEYNEKPDVVISRIKNALGKVSNRIFARNCKGVEIDKDTAKGFLNRYHLQGYGRSLYQLGIYTGDLLVGVMTAAPISRTHVVKDKALELKRLAFLPDYSVIGGASKLFTRLCIFARFTKYNSIRSYCDMRYGSIDSTVYDRLGFKLVGETKWTPHYISDKYRKRIRNQSLRKTPEERLIGKTEWELRKAQGYDRIWDCGHRTYEFVL